MKNSYSNFYKTEDGEQIFFTTNFKPGKHKGKVLIFNYGLVCSNHHWRDQISFFDELGYSILTHDYRGHYQSSSSQDLDKISFNQLAKDLNGLINHLNLTNNILLGHSMGVNISLEYSKLYSENVNKLVLISGTILPVHNIMMDTHLTGSLKPIILKIVEKFPKEFNLFWKYGGWNPVIKKMIHTGGFNIEKVSPEFIEIYLNKIGQLGPELFFQLIDQMQEHDILAFINQINTKTLIIGGNRDKVIPNFLQRLMHEKLKNSELYIIHQGSHVPQVDYPKNTNERIKLFLES